MQYTCIRAIIYTDKGKADNPQTAERLIKMREVAIVFDEYNNEIFFGETVGECHNYCDTHNITGEHGEYIGIGVFYENTRYFELEDYEGI